MALMRGFAGRGRGLGIGLIVVLSLSACGNGSSEIAATPDVGQSGPAPAKTGEAVEQLGWSRAGWPCMGLTFPDIDAGLIDKAVPDLVSLSEEADGWALLPTLSDQVGTDVNEHGLAFFAPLSGVEAVSRTPLERQATMSSNVKHLTRVRYLQAEGFSVISEVDQGNGTAFLAGFIIVETEGGELQWFVDCEFSDHVRSRMIQFLSARRGISEPTPGDLSALIGELADFIRYEDTGMREEVADWFWSEIEETD